MAKKDKSEKKDKSRKKEELAEALGELLPAMVQANRAMRTRLSRNLQDSGLYAGQDGVIQALAEEDGLTPGALAAKLGVKAPTMTRTIGRLEVQGFVDRRSDAGDARLTKVHLTDTGRATLAKIELAAGECSQQAIEGMSGKEVRTLVRLLRLATGNLQAVQEV